MSQKTNLNPAPVTGGYDALLDAHETRCRLNCGCILHRPFTDHAAVAIKYCPLHSAANDLLVALADLLYSAKKSPDEWEVARAAIAKATGTQPPF